MLIAWKWNDLKRNKCVVDPDLLARPEYANILDNIESVAGKLFDEYQVEEAQPDGRTEPLKPAAKIVRTSINRTMGQADCPCMDYLKRLIEYYQDEDRDLMVFLHRRDGFAQDDVQLLSRSFNLKGCFLIGDGRDYIYYRPERKQGLLGDNGLFYMANPEPEEGIPEIRTSKRGKKIVFARYFRKVWTYYEHEFYTKIYELREDLLSHFYQLTDDRKAISAQVLQDHLNTNRILFLRLISFIDDECCTLNTDQAKELDDYGKGAAKAYEFDDLKANLQSHQNITDEYTEVSKLLHDTLFHDQAQSVDSTNAWMREVDQKFTQLLEAITPMKP